MKAPLKFRPDLRACELEDRLVPVTSNPGVIVLTTEGYILMSTFPGAMSYITNAPGGPSIPTRGKPVSVQTEARPIKTGGPLSPWPSSSPSGSLPS